MQYLPSITVAHSDNRSNYEGMLVHVQGNVSRRFNLVAKLHVVVGENVGLRIGRTFDYVNGVCNPLNPFGPGDYGRRVRTSGAVVW